MTSARRPPDAADIALAIGAAQAELAGWPRFHDPDDSIQAAAERRSRYHSYTEASQHRLAAQGFRITGRPGAPTRIRAAGIAAASTGGLQAALRLWVAKARAAA
ncbi:MAG: hypothetical protein ACK4OP_01545 [Gemmobacter sp.]